MKIFDMHAHLSIDAKEGRPEELLSRMAAAGVCENVVMSPDPTDNYGRFLPYEQRMEVLDAWTRGHEDVLYPVCWLHPYEDAAIHKAEDACARGVAGFKMICDSYYVYEDRSMELVSAIAKTGKPLIFHSGILWGGIDTSKYNRPLNFEALLNVPGLKFSMGHCSWPWYDECIALYGKFLNAYSRRPELSAEMFFDLTPGTPEIYRRDLLYKLFNVGYDVPHNIMFGTDSTANDYLPEWTKKWIAIDGALYDELKVPQSIRELVFRGNALRFFGKLQKDFTHICPEPDKADGWHL